MFKKVKKALKNPKLVALYVLGSRFSKIIPDKLYLKIKYYLIIGKKLNLNNPQSFNEKLQWLKLYDRRPEYTMMVDKFEVRKYIQEKIGEEYLIPLLGDYACFEEIDFDKLPNQFVLKPNHTSGNFFICKDKSKIDYPRLRELINSWLKRRYYWVHREWPYKNVKPRIICEEFITQDDGEELRDYRFFCFNGDPKFITVDFSITNKSKTRRNLYDLDWNLMDEEISYPKELNFNVKKPDKLEEMINLSRKLSSGLPHARIDFYYIQGKILFGEITFFHQSGMGDVRPLEFERKMGDWLKLPNSKAVKGDI